MFCLRHLWWRLYTVSYTSTITYAHPSSYCHPIHRLTTNEWISQWDGSHLVPVCEDVTACKLHIFLFAMSPLLLLTFLLGPKCWPFEWQLATSLANARPHLNPHWDEVWEPHIHFLLFEAWFTIARSRLLAATNVYHTSLYVAHSQSKPSFLVMKEF